MRGRLAGAGRRRDRESGAERSGGREIGYSATRVPVGGAAADGSVPAEHAGDLGVQGRRRTAPAGRHHRVGLGEEVAQRPGRDADHARQRGRPQGQRDVLAGPRHLHVPGRPRGADPGAAGRRRRRAPAPSAARPAAPPSGPAAATGAAGGRRRRAPPRAGRRPTRTAAAPARAPATGRPSPRTISQLTVSVIGRSRWVGSVVAGWVLNRVRPAGPDARSVAPRAHDRHSTPRAVRGPFRADDRGRAGRRPVELATAGPGPSVGDRADRPDRPAEPVAQGDAPMDVKRRVHDRSRGCRAG